MSEHQIDSLTSRVFALPSQVADALIVQIPAPSTTSGRAHSRTS